MKWLINALAKAGDMVNGKKTVLGLAFTAVGIGLFFTPAAVVAKEVVVAGLTLTVGGAIHKAQKKKNGGN